MSRLFPERGLPAFLFVLALAIVVVDVAAILALQTVPRPAPSAGPPIADRGSASPAGEVWPSPLVPPGPPPYASSRPADLRRAVLAAPWPLSAADTRFYRMVIMRDGYPAARINGRVLAHPLYGTYLITGFLRLARDGHPRARAALAAVAYAAVERMSPYRGTLVFWYGQRSVPLARIDHRAYSALTQARYADLLAQAALLLHDDRLIAAAGKVFRSLLIPVDDGGVLRPGRYGPVLEEEAVRVPSAILNGWLSALAAARSYARLTDSVAAAELVRDSARELADRLARYDLPRLKGSSYGASAMLSIRVTVPVGTVVRAATLTVDGVHIPLALGREGQGSDIVRVRQCGQRGRGGIHTVCSELWLDVPVTAGGTDPTSVVRLRLDGPGVAPLTARVGLGRYRFRHRVGRTVVGWRNAGVVRSKTSRATVTVPVSLGTLRAAQTPTTFIDYGGRMVNGYHGIHIGRLEALAAEGGPQFARYADRWRRYRCDWAGHPAYTQIPRRDLTC